MKKLWGDKKGTTNTTKLFSILLALYLTLALLPAGPVLAADAPDTADAMEDALAQYRIIAAQADSYDFQNPDFPNGIYTYALVSLSEDSTVPALLLRKEYGEYYQFYVDDVRVFQYDPASGTVFAPPEVISFGVGGGGYRGGIATGFGGLISYSWGGATGDTWVARVTVNGNELVMTKVWQGIYTEMKDVFEAGQIEWLDLATLATAQPDSGPVASDIPVLVNGVAVTWPEVEPFIDENDRTMVPLRPVANAMGLTVDWDNDARMASFSNGSKTLYFPIDSSTARTSDGSTIQMDTAAIIVEGRTFAPVRYLAEYFGFTVGWNDATRTVSITK